MSSETTEYKREKVSQRFAGDIYEEAKPVANFMAISGVFAGAVGILITWFVPVLGLILGAYALACAAEGIMYSKYRVMGAWCLVTGMTAVFVSVGPAVYSIL